MKIILIAIYLSCLSTFAHSQSTLAVIKYLNTVLNTPNCSDPDDWKEADRGGYLYRFSLSDLGAQGPYLFLSTSMELEKGTVGNWSVYYNQNGMRQPFDKPVCISWRMIDLAPSTLSEEFDIIKYTKPQRDEVPSAVNALERTKGRFDRYHFLPPILQVSSQYVSDDDFAGYTERIKMKQVTDFKAEVVLISNYLKNPSSSWTELTLSEKESEKNFIVHNDFLHLKDDLLTEDTRPSFSRADALTLIKVRLSK